MINLIRESVGSIKPYEVSKEYIQTKLDANENPFNLFEELKESFIEKIEKLEINRYPDTDSDHLRESFAKYAGVKIENILCGNGSDEIIGIIIRTFVDKEEYVITHSPTFSMYKISTVIAGGRIVEVPCNEEFEINVDEIIKEANTKKAKLIFLCNPNNPTGTIIPREDIEKIIKETAAIVVVDEAYYEFLDETVVDLINSYDRLIILRTLSKAFALGGARIGYGIANENTMNALYKVKAPYNLNTFSQIVGKLFMENVELINASVKKIQVEREYLINQLENIRNIKVFPTGSNFVLIKSTSAENILKMCKKEGISIRAFVNDGLLMDCIRITIGTREENNQLLNVVKKAV